MWNQFILEHLHFAINVFASFVFFAVFWLYWDAYKSQKLKNELIKSIGFLLLSFSFLIHSVFVESTLLTASILPQNVLNLAFILAKILGYLLLIAGLSFERLQKHPEEKEVKANLAIPIFIKGSFPSLFFPIMPLVTAISYQRHATYGFESHLKAVATAFFILAIAEVISLGSIFRDTQNFDLYRLVSEFGPLWIFEHAVVLCAILISGRWVWGYLLKQFFTQLFMIFTVAFLLIFLLTTLIFSGLLLKNLQDETLSRLETDVKVLSFSFESKKEESLSDAQVIAQNSEIKKALVDKDRKILGEILEDFLLAKRKSQLLVLDAKGEILARGEERQDIGGSLSGDPLVKRVLVGESVSTVVSREGVVTSEVSVVSATPIKDEGEIIGAVLVGEQIDNAFVDGVARETGLAATVYAGNQISATTLKLPDGKTRPLGAKEEKEIIKNKVLVEGENFLGAINVLGTPYFVSYLPLNDIDDVAIGMLFVGKPQITVLQTAAASIELTFLFSAVLIAMSIIPSHFISRHLASQIR